MFARILIVSLLVTSLVISGAMAQEPNKPSPPPDTADVLAQASQAKIVEAQKLRNSAQERFAQVKERFRNLVARWNAGIDSPVDSFRELIAIAKEAGGAAKLQGEADKLLTEVRQTAPSQARPKGTSVSTPAQTGDPALPRVVAQDATTTPKAAVAQKKDTNAKK